MAGHENVRARCLFCGIGYVSSRTDVEAGNSKCPKCGKEATTGHFDDFVLSDETPPDVEEGGLAEPPASALLPMGPSKRRERLMNCLLSVHKLTPGEWTHIDTLLKVAFAKRGDLAVMLRAGDVTINVADFEKAKTVKLKIGKKK
jgi:hypothetical protein